METVLLVGGLIVGLVTAGAVVVLLIRLQKVSQPKDDSGLKLLLQQMNELSRTVDAKMGETTKQMGETMRNQFRESANLIKGVTEGLVKLDETNKQVVSFADQLQNLQDILKNPKQRGILGEYYLETLLKNVLPPSNYKMQYAFSNGEIVDAVVFVKEKIIPIDSKFSLENYNRLAEAKDPSEKERLEKLFINDLKLRIQETSKYIRPAEGTMDFAFMFIPHEAIYYDLLVNKIGLVTEDSENLIQKAASKYKVLIVSPTSFLAYLQTVMQGLKALQIEESAKTIRANVENLQKHLQGYVEYHQKLGNALSTTVNHYTASGKEFKKIDKDILRITDSSMEFEPLVIDRPDREE
ncbi:MAG: DNA recombination protein RmuC [Candidatus Taylorbacteria bacterium CG11_big_fil_rev_8_21_14_0_20_46_11]|uniref:DNA recombination protein RmuC n=1 Tax=Candidatus Taylorbacteria bacterium CG11_big_fil_rev_8_21_14_0_20_46_11 TaxID=1975025 RepID=A0A2H0KB26_9BACT|nr:MAG: DNA recombination protein RmuC [Candidatus Taylorbacteria bacterium CG11_big_fil_rev_8_21_14_0_20_46_11]